MGNDDKDYTFILDGQYDITFNTSSDITYILPYNG